MNVEPQAPTTIRPALPTDADSIVEIYNHYVTTSVISFEEQAVSADEMSARIELQNENSLPWLIAENPDSQELYGFAHASRWRARSAYRHTVEVSVYTQPALAVRGIGSQLYESLFDTLRGRSVRMLVATIALPNDASIALHEKFGLEKVAHYPEVGYKLGRWVDVGVWQGRLSDPA